jgi:hypothetical protein
MDLSSAELDDYLAAELATSVVTMSVYDPQGSPLRETRQDAVAVV